MSLETRTPLIFGLLGGLWLLLSNGDTASWIVGLPVVAGATWAARQTHSTVAEPVFATSFLRFIPYFLWESVRGGIDVALRTLTPRMRIRPGFAEFRTGLRRQDARIFLVNCLSLMPGTLAADLTGDLLDVHLLDTRSTAEAELRRLERIVARIFPERTVC